METPQTTPQAQPGGTAPPPRTPRLLAPAGGRDEACAALHYGADAVYLGLRRFSARADAPNFDETGLREITAYAHALAPRREVYVAFNTLIPEREWRDALDTLARLEEIGVDAVIVQDLGVARRVRFSFPGLRLFASTQMAVHSPEGARALARRGFSCVLLARELSLEEIAAVVRDGGGVEVETFVHGALCYSYSGLCLFSSHATGRSGNRGRCASCCREAFRDARGRPSFPFSMKDLALGRRLAELRTAGVAALKIEGRLKGPLYVAAVTDYHRRLLDGRLNPAERRTLEEDLKTIFSRPWTELYADGGALPESVIDSRTIGHRGARIGEVRAVRRERGADWLIFATRRPIERHDGLQVDVPGVERPYGFALDDLRGSGDGKSKIRAEAGDEVAVRLPPDHPPLPTGAPVCCSSSQAVKRRYAFPRPRPGEYRVRHPVHVAARIAADALEVTGRARAPGLPPLEASLRWPGPFEAARDPAGTPAAMRKAFDRLGDTDWKAESFDLEDPEARFVPAAVWNEARRRLAAELDKARDNARAARIEALADTAPAIPAAAAPAAEEWSLRLDEPPAAGLDDADEWVLPIALCEGAGDSQIRAALPTILRGAVVAETRMRVRALLKRGWRKWELGSLAGWELLRETAQSLGLKLESFDLSADWPLYTLNREAADELADLGFQRCVTSPEDDGENLRARLRSEAGRMTVLVFQYTPLFLSATPPAGDSPVWFGRKGERFVPVRNGELHALVMTRPFALAARLAELRAAGARRFRCDLTYARAAGADPAALWSAVRRGENPPEFHEGNYTRGLL